MNPPPCRDCPQAERCSREKLACGVFRQYVGECTYKRDRGRFPTRETYLKTLTREGIEEDEVKQIRLYQQRRKR
jgi:hypothetical protein